MTRITGAKIAELCTSVHADNVTAGWWSDLNTGQRLDRNVGELLMLCVSEVCEGADGLAGNLMDDKLPHRQMIEVELADFLIRAFDLGGGLGLTEDLADAFQAARPRLGEVYRSIDTPNDYLLQIICFISAAMEHHRKGRVQEMAIPLAYAMHGAFILGEILDLDVMAAIEEKRAFNKTRLDHQIESRKAAGGKAY